MNTEKKKINSDKINNIILIILIFIPLLIAINLILLSFLPLNFTISLFKLNEYVPSINKYSIHIPFFLRLTGCYIIFVCIATFIFRKKLSFFIKEGKPFLLEIKNNLLKMVYNLSIFQKLLIINILFFSFILRFHFIFQPVRYDEAFTYLYYANKPIPILISDYSFPNNHIFHTLLVRLSLFILGDGLFSLRMPAFISGFLIVPATYIVCCQFTNINVAILSTAFVATSSILIEYSTNARGYTIITLFFLIIIFLSKIIQEKQNHFAFIMLSIISALGFFTIPVMLYPYSIVFIWSMIAECANNKIDKIYKIKYYCIYTLLTIIIVIHLYFPAIFFSGYDKIIFNRFIKPMDISSIMEKLPIYLYNLICLFLRDINITIIIILCIGLFFFIKYSIIYKNNLGILALSMLIIMLSALFIQRVLPYERVWLFILPMFFIYCSFGIWHLIEITNLSYKTKEFIFLKMTILVLILNIIYVINNNSIINSKETGVLGDAELIAKDIKEFLGKNDCVLSECPSDAILNYYFKKYGILMELQKKAIDYCNNTFIVVNDLWGQSVEKILEKNI